MLGVGAAGAAVASQVPLFGVNTSTLINPIPHLVFEQVPLITGSFKVPGSGGIFFKCHSGSPARYKLSDLSQRTRKWGEPCAARPALIYDEYQKDVIVGPHDPHVAFYQAAMNLRDDISLKLQEDYRADGPAPIVSSDGLPHEGSIVTVGSPIMAIPKEDQGFYLQTTLGHMIVVDEQIVDPDITPMSRTGEIPIEIPHDLDMKLMMMLDREAVALGFVDNRMPKLQEAWKRANERRRA